MKKFNPATVERMLKSFYVDNFLESVTDTEQAKIILAKELIEIL